MFKLGQIASLINAKKYKKYHVFVSVFSFAGFVCSSLSYVLRPLSVVVFSIQFSFFLNCFEVFFATFDNFRKVKLAFRWGPKNLTQSKAKPTRDLRQQNVQSATMTCRGRMQRWKPWKALFNNAHRYRTSNNRAARNRERVCVTHDFLPRNVSLFRRM